MAHGDAINEGADCSVLQSPTSSTHPPHHRHLHPVQQLPELRPPPARYSAHTSNLVGFSSLPGAKSVGRWSRADEGSCRFRHLPRNNVLCQLLAAMIALLVFVQAISCGLFFCVRLPFSPRPYVDYRDLISELDMGSATTAGPSGGSTSSSGGNSLTAFSSRSFQQLNAPKLIPRAIHQTYRSTRLPASAKQFMHSWQERNGEAWQVRLYSDEACLNFVRREFPEYFEAYMNLPKEVERADFFRYMVILRLGGVYADVDVECRQPLDSIIQPSDTLLVGWDAELPDLALAAQRQYARQRQVATWFFAAAPGHPVLRELCDHIARNAMTVFSNNTVRDTLERTGQGIWTDLVLRYALEHPAAKHDDPWKVRILPRVAFGVHPSGDDELTPHLPGVVVLHHFLGRWQWQGSWARRAPAHRKALQVVAPFLPQQWVRHDDVMLGSVAPIKGSNITHYPVSVDFYPPFTMMVDLVGAGDKQAETDVSAAVTAHGTWQPAVAPYRRPAVVEALVGALSRHSSTIANSPVGSAGSTSANSQAGAATANTAAAADPAAAASVDTSSQSSATAAAAKHVTSRGVLVDVGAGHGFFSLAAAARGHKVVAFETAPGSLAAFRASIKYNGFGNLIEVQETVIGAQTGTVCLEQHAEHSSSGTVGSSVDNSVGNAEPGTVTAGGADYAYGNSSSIGVQRYPERRLVPAAVLRRRRGYPHLEDSRIAEQQDSSSCAVTRSRQRLSDALANTTGIAVLRISAHGHEGFVIQGALDLLRANNKPDVVYLEFCPAAMQAAGYKTPKQLLQQLYELGYTDVAHAGRVCDQRWFNVTHGFRLQGTFSSSAHAMLQQPTWCKLRPENFQMLIERADPSVPENVLFVLGHPSHQDINTTTSNSSSTTASATVNSSSKAQQSDRSSTAAVASSQSNSSHYAMAATGSSLSAAGAEHSAAFQPQRHDVGRNASVGTGSNAMLQPTAAASGSSKRAGSMPRRIGGITTAANSAG